MQGMGSDFFRPTGREKLLTMRKHARHAYAAGSNPPQNKIILTIVKSVVWGVVRGCTSVFTLKQIFASSHPE